VTGRDPDRLATDIVHLSDQIAALDGIYDVRGLDDPLGQRNGDLGNLLHVSTQLRLAQQMMTASQPTSFDPAQIQALLSGFEAYLDLLVARGYAARIAGEPVATRHAAG